MAAPQVARVLYCTEFNEELGQCTAQAWLPAPSLLPPLTLTQVEEIFPWMALCFAAAYCWKLLGRQTRQ